MPRILHALLLTILGLSIAGCPSRRGGAGGGGDDDDSAGDDDDSAGDDDDDDSNNNHTSDDDDAANPDEDSDGDGLTNGFEAQIGTDPNDDDTDGDGFSDAFEVLAYFRPDDSGDRPYTGGYPRGPLPSDSEWASLSAGSNWSTGSFSGDWTLVDQHGQDIRLRDFYGQVVMVEIGAEWCPSCRQAAESAEYEYDGRADAGFTLIHLLLDGYNPGDQNPDVNRWISDFGLTMPVLDDGQMGVTAHYLDPNSSSFGLPLFGVVGRDHTVEVWNYQGSPGPWSSIGGLLDASPPSVDWPLPENANELRNALGFGSSMWRGYVDAM